MYIIPNLETNIYVFNMYFYKKAFNHKDYSKFDLYFLLSWFLKKRALSLNV